MGWLTFFSSLIDSLAWPAAVILGVLLFRKPLADLVPLLRRLKYKEFEVEFERGLEAARIEAADVIPEPTTFPAEAGALAERVVELARVSPRATIFEAWRDVEMEARALAERRQLDLHDRELKVPLRLGDALNVRGVITKDEVGLYHRLRQLRNEAVHADEFVVDAASAVDFATIAHRLAGSFRGR